jgi:uncharacterized protein (DUF433 family)
MASNPRAASPNLGLIRKTPGVLGGQTRIQNRRIAVWMLVRCRQLGMTNDRIRERYEPPLTDAQLDAAWSYYAGHTKRD